MNDNDKNLTYKANAELILECTFLSYKNVAEKSLWNKLARSTGCPNNDCFFSKAHCSYKNYPILKISSLLGRQWIDFYVGIIYNNISSF